MRLSARHRTLAHLKPPTTATYHPIYISHLGCWSLSKLDQLLVSEDELTLLRCKSGHGTAQANVTNTATHVLGESRAGATMMYPSTRHTSLTVTSGKALAAVPIAYGANDPEQEMAQDSARHFGRERKKVWGCACKALATSRRKGFGDQTVRRNPQHLEQGRGGENNIIEGMRVLSKLFRSGLLKRLRMRRRETLVRNTKSLPDGTQGGMRRRADGQEYQTTASNDTRGLPLLIRLSIHFERPLEAVGHFRKAEKLGLPGGG
ncbi:hypothetical protein EKO04_011408 [Ascochyta lentis]|uniref:Uncharacterized protein n=1 Tax=Ascochyta lentis TaxID=205686 RepID=A0A8H7ITW7_9PLEO|nr:hypothetical protein EKO04_011408 [Ascochyta lentis]